MANNFSNEMSKVLKQATKQGLVVDRTRTGRGKVIVHNEQTGGIVRVSGSPGSHRCFLNNIARMRRYVGFIYNGH
jgi:hypothetical protein